MPLQAERVARSAPAHRFDDAVGGRQRLDRESAAERLDRLVVDRTDRCAPGPFVEPAQAAARDDLDFMRIAIVRIRVYMAQRAGQLRRDVLIQRAAERNVDELQAAADAEHRLALDGAFPEQLDLVQVANPVSRPFRPQRLLAVGGRAHVRAALQHQAVERSHVIAQTDARTRDARALGNRRNHEGERAVGQQPVRHRLLEVLQRLAPKTQFRRHPVHEPRRQPDAQPRPRAHCPARSRSTWRQTRSGSDPLSA